MKYIVVAFILFINLVFAKDIEEYKSVKVLETTIASRITNAISLYTNKTFNVDVHIFVTQIDVAKNQLHSNEKVLNLPGVYLYNEDEEDKNILTKDATSQSIDHIEIVITMDESVDPFIFQMAKKIAKEKADLSQRRGDKVSIKKMRIFKKNDVNELAQIVKKTLFDFEKSLDDIKNEKNQEMRVFKEDVANVQIKTLEKIDRVKAKINQELINRNQERAYEIKKLQDTIKQNNERLYYWLGFLTFALLVAAYLGFLYASHRAKNLKENIRYIEDDFQKEIQQIDNKLDKKMSEVKTSSLDDVDEALINDLATLVLARKDGVKDFILEALVSEKGKEKIALLVQHIGMRSIESMFYNSKEILQEILLCVENYSFDQKEVALKIDHLYKELLQYTNTLHSGTTSLDALAFLKKLSIDQLLLLLENEDVTIKAFIISQIDKQKSAALFERLPEDTRMYLYMEIANIKPMSDKEYSLLANKLSKKIVNLPNINNYVVDGKEEMVERMKLLEPSAQKKMLETLMTQNIELYQYVREHYFFFQDIVEQDESVLKNLIFNSSDDTVALSLMQMNEDDRNKILSIMNERKMVMIEDRIRYFMNEEKPSKEMLIQAQYRLTQELEKALNL